MKLIFENELGKAELFGGGDEKIRITAIEGLGVPSYERRSHTSFDFDGAVESGRHFTRRNIVVSGDIRATAREASDFIKLFSESGGLRIVTDSFDREITVSSCESEYQSTNNGYVKFVLSFTCDDPYFYDSQESKTGLYVRERLIDGETSFPALFSRRTTGASIAIKSDRDIEPTIIILGGERVDDGEGKIVIENILTGAIFTLNYVPERDEVITINVRERSIKSSLVGNLVGYISDDSFLSDLTVSKFGAQFVTTGYGATGNVTAYILYKNKYLEAML